MLHIFIYCIYLFICIIFVLMPFSHLGWTWGHSFARASKQNKGIGSTNQCAKTETRITPTQSHDSAMTTRLCDENVALGPSSKVNTMINNDTEYDENAMSCHFHQHITSSKGEAK